MMNDTKLLLGQTLSFCDNPFLVPPESATTHHVSGAILIREGKIVDIGAEVDLITKYPEVVKERYSDCLLLPGFIDAHSHYPQNCITARWGYRLIDWLNHYTFPEEQKFGDYQYARGTAECFIKNMLNNGITTSSTFCTIHSESVDAIFEEARKRNLRFLAGKTCMDRNAPKSLLDTPEKSFEDSQNLIKKWHNKGRLSCVISPRFAPTSSPEQLTLLGELWKQYPECLMQTHLCEQFEEIAWVKTLFPNAKDYLDVYEKYHLLGERGLYGHCIHLNQREAEKIKEANGRLIHCPTSNTFIGSGLFPTKQRVMEGYKVGLATDIGGGYSFSMLRVMASAYEISQLKGQILHPAQLIWLATAGNAEALHLQHLIGNLQVGNEADIIALHLRSTPHLELLYNRSKTVWESIFSTIMLGDERAIRQVWIEGVPNHDSKE